MCMLNGECFSSVLFCGWKMKIATGRRHEGRRRLRKQQADRKAEIHNAVLVLKNLRLRNCTSMAIRRQARRAQSADFNIQFA